jgi:lysophospholipase L1-like esterase
MMTNEKTITRLRKLGLFCSVAVAILLTAPPTAIAQRDLKVFDYKSLVKKRSPDGPLRTGEIICVGSSHMAIWRTVRKDLAPLTIYNFGIGGTTMQDTADHFARELVVPYKPRAVILYEGSNDIARDMTPKEILGHFRRFYGLVRKALPETRFYVMGIVPSPGDRFKKWDTIKQANEALQKECKTQPWLTFIDTTSGLIGKDGTPRLECFLPKNFHMNAAGYKVWAKAVAPVVVKAEKWRTSKEK